MEKTIRKIEKRLMALPRKKRVAAYARVSSSKFDALHSLSAQISSYSEYIQKHKDWEYVGVYADEGLSGTKDTRPEFQRLLSDCRAGKIDLIVTKSISRFARNTLTLLETTRALKEIGVGVFFEKEGLYSDHGQGEMILTLMAAVAQEESRDVSDNCKWRIRNRFKEGELHGMAQMYGYDIRHGEMYINEEQAKVVRRIFASYLSGMGCDRIAKELRATETVGVFGGTWSAAQVLRILKNEKYTGDSILQKQYVADHMTKKLVLNKGELPKYYAENTHPGIISREDYVRAAEIREQHYSASRGKEKPRTPFPFTGIITCEQCGKHYKRKTTHGRIFWVCSTFNQYGKAACPSKQIPEPTLFALTAQVLGVSSFDAELFKREISAMRIPSANRVVYIFRDGHEVEAEWKDRSRAESWTDEKKQAASERSRMQWQHE